ncbi:MAG: FAD-binding oxidoreductase [Gammaproteobacteria bacterium]|nr:FAD-binding oxidoreductase [Gammaproteobacteria bacterium]
MMVAVGLVRKGYDVTVVSDRTPEEIRNGRVTSSQGMQATPIAYEREMGLRLWEDVYQPWEGIEFNVLSPEDGSKVSSFAQRVGPTNGSPDWLIDSIDQRVKMPAWIYRFEELGGKMLYETADLPALDRYAAESDLVLVASGKGEIGKLLERDDEKSVYDKPQRALGLAYVRGMEPIKTRDHGVINRGLTWNAVPGVGEYFVCNALTTSGECDIMIFEAIPGGPADVLDMRDGPEQYLKNCVDVLKKFYPHEAERCQNIELTDDLGILSGRFPPTIRKPLMRLPGGGLAMGIADAVCLNDPITGQGSCNAAKFAKVVYDAVLNRVHEPFDGDWMQQVFDTYWEQAEAVVQWTNHLLDGPGPAASKLLMAANDNQDIADFLLRGMDDANRLMPYFFDEAAADDLIGRLTRRVA